MANSLKEGEESFINDTESIDAANDSQSNLLSLASGNGNGHGYRGGGDLLLNSANYNNSLDSLYWNAWKQKISSASGGGGSGGNGEKPGSSLYMSGSTSERDIHGISKKKHQYQKE